jgi:hypothetical protein
MINKKFLNAQLVKLYLYYMEKRDKFEGLNSIKFNQYFQNDADCYRYTNK